MHRFVFASLSLWAVFVSVPIMASGQAPLRPNFVIILADDMGYGDSSVYDGWLETPQMERMAREGLTFTDFHSSGTVCSPTRAGLMTGRYQQRAGIPGVINADPQLTEHHWGIQPQEITFAELLGAAGYRTAIFGKWHLGYHRRYNPVRHGFDEFRGFVSGNIDYISHRDRMGTADWWNGERLEPEDGYLTHLITRHAVDFIRRHRDVPFCLYVAHGAVHTPIQGPNSPPQRGPEALSRERREDQPRDEIIRQMMRALDDSVGAVLDTLEEHSLAEKTFVLFFSDNGGAAHMRNDPLRGRKGQVFEGGHRVPAIAWWPGTIAPGQRTDQLCISLDVMPTLLALAGVEQPAERPLDGSSLVPLLIEGEPLGRRQLFWNGVAMRDGPWKLVVQGKQPRLYNLEDDLGEEQDVSRQHPQRVAEMQQALDDWRDDVGQGATPQPAKAP